MCRKSGRLCIGAGARAGPTYACAGGKLSMQLGLQDVVCHAILMVCSRSYVPGLAKRFNTGLKMVVGIGTVTRMMIYNKQTCTSAVICYKRRLPLFTQLARRPSGVSVQLGNAREALEATCSSTGQTTKCRLSDQSGQASSQAVARYATGR